MLNSVDLFKGLNLVLEQYDVYSWISFDVIIVFIILGIFNVLLLDSFNFFVLYVIFCKKDGLEIKLRK